jgi:putative membrane protein
MHTLLYLASLTATVLALSRLLPDVRVRRLSTAVIVAVVFSVLNFFLATVTGWVVRTVLFLPAVFTLGILFLFVPFIVNVVMLWLTDKMIKNFRIDSIRALLISAGAITAVNWFFASPMGHAFCARCAHF